MRKVLAVSAAVLSLAVLTVVPSRAAEKNVKWTHEGGRWVATYTVDTGIGDGGRLVVKNFAGDLQMNGSKAKKARLVITYYARKSDDRKDAERHLDDRMPSVNLNGNEVLVKGEHKVWSWVGNHKDAFKLTADLPSKFKLDASTSGGRVEATSLEGDCDLATSGGDIYTRNIVGDLTVATSGGTIRLEKSKGTVSGATSGGDVIVEGAEGDVEVATSGGRLSIKDVKGSVDGSTSGGGIDVRDVTGESASLSTSGGSVRVVGVNLTKKGDFSTSGGGINTENTSGRFTLSTHGGEVDVSEHDGGLNVSTSAGGLHLEDVDGSVSGSTGSGDVYLSLKSGEKGDKGRYDLTTGNGDILVKIPAKMGAYIEASVAHTSDEDDIQSDFSLKYTHKSSHLLRAQGDINGGGVPILLETGSGKIDIQKR